MGGLGGYEEEVGVEAREGEDVVYYAFLVHGAVDYCVGCFDGFVEEVEVVCFTAGRRENWWGTVGRLCMGGGVAGCWCLGWRWWGLNRVRGVSGAAGYAIGWS